MVSAEERRWRWHNRWHRNETTNGITQTDQASKTNQMGQETKKDKGETWEELDKLKGSFMALWEERRKAASEAQNQANERAREFAREKMDSLSATLEMLRQRLEKEDEEKRRVV
ncbi:hypothetical protein TREMEDRAFT_59138 [Tremella mesenterica DSM 1558]|nr:uncharacterized protein TREMEDRAFT_59138 [Tremella mesenterica DSM 1558]EIW72976.1 hypothetical protein TREMEDRAFT_59138 [Tremella mesenterica DSM 1558]